MKCKICKTKKALDFEDIGLGLYCEDCLDKENKIYELEL